MGDFRRFVEQSIGDWGRRHVYYDTLDELNLTFGVFYEVPCQRDLIGIFFWVVLSEKFLPLLADMEKEALVVLAYFCILLNKLPAQWWLDGWVNYLMEKIYDTLGEEHRIWIQWPMEELGWLPSGE